MTELKSFDRVAQIYDETRGMPEGVSRAVVGAIAGVLHELSPAPRLFEVGIGTGRIAAPLAAEGVRITGIDISPKMLAHLRAKRRDIDVMFAEASHPPIRPGSFDASLFVHILHLVPDAEATVRATVDVVRRGGLMLRGQEERSPGSLDERAFIVLRDSVQEVAGVTLPGRDRHLQTKAAFERVLEERRATLEKRHVVSWARPLTAREVLETFRRRDFSGAWEIPEAAVPAIAEHMSPALVAMFGGMDAPQGAERSFELTIARLP